MKSLTALPLAKALVTADGWWRERPPRRRIVRRLAAFAIALVGRLGRARAESPEPRRLPV